MMTVTALLSNVLSNNLRSIVTRNGTVGISKNMRAGI